MSSGPEYGKDPVVVPISQPKAKKPSAKGGHFAKVPTAAICDPRVSPEALRVLAALGIYADRHGYCWPAVGTIAKRLQLTRQGVHYHLRKLKGLGHVEIERRRGPLNADRSNLYRILFPTHNAESQPATQCDDISIKET